MIARIVNAILLRESTYHEVAEDGDATLDAIFLVMIYVLATTIPYAFNGTFSWVFIILIIPATLIMWFASTFFISFITERLFHGEGDMLGLIRAMGYATSAGILMLLALFPGVGYCLTAMIGMQLLVANVIAVRAGMKIGTLPAIGSLFLGNAIASMLAGCLLVPIILFMGPEALINTGSFLP